MGICLLGIGVLADGWSVLDVSTAVIAVRLGLLNAVSARLYQAAT